MKLMSSGTLVTRVIPTTIAAFNLRQVTAALQFPPLASRCLRWKSSRYWIFTICTKKTKEKNKMNEIKEWMCTLSDSSQKKRGKNCRVLCIFFFFFGPIEFLKILSSLLLIARFLSELTYLKSKIPLQYCFPPYFAFLFPFYFYLIHFYFATWKTVDFTLISFVWMAVNHATVSSTWWTDLMICRLSADFISNFMYYRLRNKCDTVSLLLSYLFFFFFLILNFLSN